MNEGQVIGMNRKALVEMTLADRKTFFERLQSELPKRVQATSEAVLICVDGFQIPFFS